MKIREAISKLDIFPSKEDIKSAEKEVALVINLIEKDLKKTYIDAEVFVGGSYAKKTIVRSLKKDIDVFVRFDWKYEDISTLLEKVIDRVCRKLKTEFSRVHGSRDYFRIERGDSVIEIIPVVKIKHPREARNVTDLSYFHVNYVKRKINEKMAREIIAAKAFCKAQGVYGAESYVHGFSGYALECLLIYYKSFERMLKSLANVKERLIIDPEKAYRNKKPELEMNESKIRSPIVLVDPTWKERNVLAALSKETFVKFQNSAKAFLRRPSREYFVEKEFDAEKIRSEAKKTRAEFLHLSIVTDRQEGDIAGTKMKKFAYFLREETRKYFDVLRDEFVYKEGESSDYYLSAKPMKEIVQIGPPLNMKKHASAFKREHKKTFVKNGRLHAKIKVDFNLERFIENFKNKYPDKIESMGIVKIDIK